MRYTVRYTVAGFGQQETEPYELDEALAQREDIATYEGVSQAYLRAVPDATPGQRLYESLTSEIGLGVVEVLEIFEERIARAKTSGARSALEGLRGQYLDEYADRGHVLDPRYV